jgi:universal stress protein E
MNQALAQAGNERCDPNLSRARKDSAPRARLLCATDLSTRSRYALRRAALLADRFDAQLVLLHVTEPDGMIAGPPHAREWIAQQIASFGVPASHQPRIELRAGDHAQSIATAAKEWQADLIIVGSRQARSPGPLIGTTTERIAELAGVPVLIANRDPRERYGAVLMAAEASGAFIRIARIASRFGFLASESVCVVHGFESPYRGPLYAQGFDVRSAKRNIEEWEKAAGARLLRKLAGAGVPGSRYRLVFQQAHPIRVIQRVVRGIQPDLLIVGTKDRTALSRVIRGSAANDVLRRMERDILVAPPDIEAVRAL